ncbi:MAG: helix-turn-helix domain-containing protein [Pseudomonadota bacterium]
MVLDEGDYRQYPQHSAAHAMGMLEGGLRLATYDDRDIYNFALVNRLWIKLTHSFPWDREVIPVDSDLYRTTFSDERNAFINFLTSVNRETNPPLAGAIDELAHTFIEHDQYRELAGQGILPEEIFADPFTNEKRPSSQTAVSAQDLTNSEARYYSFSQMLIRGMEIANETFSDVPRDLNPLEKMFFMDDLLGKRIASELPQGSKERPSSEPPPHAWIMLLHTALHSREYGLISHRYTMPPTYIGSSRFPDSEVSSYRIIEDEFTNALNYLSAASAFHWRIKSATKEIRFVPHHRRLLKFLSCGNTLTQAEITKLLKTSQPVAANIIANLEDCGLLVSHLVSKRGPKWVAGAGSNILQFDENYHLDHPHHPFVADEMGNIAGR